MSENSGADIGVDWSDLNRTISNLTTRVDLGSENQLIRRRAKVTITHEQLNKALGMPEDTVYHRGKIVSSNTGIEFLISNSNCPRIPEGCQVPKFKIEEAMGWDT